MDHSPYRLLTGSPREIREHLLARSTLIDRLARDPGVLALFNDFPDVIDAAAAVAGLDDPEARAADDGRPRHVDKAAYLAAIDQFFAETKTVITVLHAELEERVYNDWGLEWPWLVGELIQLHERFMQAIAFGGLWRGLFTAALADQARLPDPPSPEPGENPTTYLRRVRGFYRAPPKTPTPRGRSVTDSAIERDIDALYRRRIQRLSARKVANDLFKGERGNLSRAVDRAVLRLTTAVPLPLRRRPPPLPG